MTPGGRIGALLLSLAGCAEVLDIPDDPALVASGPWRCLEEPAPAPSPAASSARVQVAACDFISEKCTTPVTGLRARLCADTADAECSSPLSVDIADEGGVLSFEVPTSPDGFAGYLVVDSAAELCTNPTIDAEWPELCGLAPACDPAAPDDGCEVPLYARALLFFNPPIVNAPTQPISLPLVPTTAMPRLMTEASGAPLDTSRGNLFITALDCDGEPAAGVSYRINRDPDLVTQLYVADGVPSEAAPRTDDSGMGGFLGVPPGFVGVTGDNAELREVGALSAFTAPLSVSYAFLAPPGAVRP